MDVTGHHAPRAAGHTGRSGVASEDVDTGGGHGRTGEDGRATFAAAMVTEPIMPSSA